MKYLIGFVILLSTVVSCKKETIQTNQLTGKWYIVNDSTSTVNFCTSCFNGSNYLGKHLDYYNFVNNGTLYIQESGAIDTAKYSMDENNQVNIATDYAVNGGGVFIYSLGLTGFLQPLSYPIKNLTYSLSNVTGHTLTLTTTGVATLTGSGVLLIKYIEIINFKR